MHKMSHLTSCGIMGVQQPQLFVGGGAAVSSPVQGMCSGQGRAVLVLALALLILAAVVLPSPAAAQTWPTSWRLLDIDANEPGGANYRDVTEASWSCDGSHLYLRLRTVDPPTFSSPSRYKWFLDTGLGSNLYLTGGNILGTDFLLFVEDSDNNGSGEVYLLPAGGDDRFTAYEPWNMSGVPPITNSNVASYRITGNYIDMWVALSALGRT